MKTVDIVAVRNEILERLRRLEPDAPRQWGKMTAHQAICHLSDSYELALGAKQASEATNIFQRTVVKWLALRAPLRWPAGVPTRPEMDQQLGGTRPVDFAQDKERLAAIIERFSRPARDIQFSRHPVFGAMTEWEWMRWGYLHADHHLRQFGL